jgi:hypothetical protein
MVLNMRNDDVKADLKTLQEITFEAYKASGALLAMLNGAVISRDSVAEAFDSVGAQYENGVVALRNICEKYHPGGYLKGAKPIATHIDLSGKIEVNEYGWLHIKLNALLPNSRYQAPAYLTDTLVRLLDEHEMRRRPLPRFDKAMLIIDEHCDIGSRMVYDPDNKGWKAVPNVLKNRVISDDDQFSLSIALIATSSKDPSCHIYVIPQEDTGDFFYLRYENYTMF